MVFPFLPFMMEFLIPKLQDDQKSVGKGNTVLLQEVMNSYSFVGKYVGFVGSSLYFGRMLGR